MSERMEPLLDMRGLRVAFPSAQGRPLEALCGVDLDIARGEILGIVGESGSGKSLSMLAVLGLLPDSAIVHGSVRLDGREILGASERQLRKLRGREIGLILQDPMTALDPVITVGEQIVEAIRVHDRRCSRKQARGRAVELLRQVKIAHPEKRVDQYPFEMSGGMRQRVVIAIALANRPRLIVADEPTTALDVTVQAQIIDELVRLRVEQGIGIALITHDLGLVAGVADRVAIMYSGRVVERGLPHDIFYGARHPYTRALLESIPRLDRAVGRLAAIDGTPPALDTRPAGCAFAPRCRRARDLCRAETPGKSSLTDEHSFECHYPEEGRPS